MGRVREELRAPSHGRRQEGRFKGPRDLQDGARLLLGLRGLRSRVQDSTGRGTGPIVSKLDDILSAYAKFRNLPNSLVEDALEISLSQGGTLKVLVSPDLLGAEQRLLVRYGLHALLSQGLEGGGVLSKIELGADEDDWDIGRVVVNLGVPL